MKTSVARRGRSGPIRIGSPTAGNALARRRRGILAILALCLAGACSLARVQPAEETSRRGPEQIRGTAVRDAAHKNQKAIEIWSGRKAEADLGAVSPGLYHVTLAGRFLGESNVRYGMRVSAAAGDQPAGQAEYWANAMPADGGYHEIRMDATVLKAGALSLDVSWLDHAREKDAKAVTGARLGELAKHATATELQGMGKLKPGEEATAGDVESELEGAPLPAGTESFLLSEIRLTRAPSPFVVTRVWPDKIHYYPQEKAAVDVEVAGVGPGAAEGTLVVEVIRGIDRTRELLREKVKLAEGEKLSRQVTFVTDEPYGCEVRATVSGAAPEARHAAGACVGVSENVFEISIQGWGGSQGLPSIVTDPGSLRKFIAMPQAELDQKAAEGALSTRLGYNNHVELFAWAPDDFFNLAPDKDVWWSGTGTYLKFKRIILAENRALQKHGIKVLSYAQPFGIGIDTIRNSRTHPELFAYAASGRPGVFYDYDLIKSRVRFDMGMRQVEPGGGLNFFDLRTVDRGIDAVIASWKMFGWDGVRYDNRYYRANNPTTFTGQPATTEKNLDPYSARNVKRQKDRFWKEIGPRWLISHNNGYRFHTEDNKLGWEETVKDGLMCMDEETCGADETASNLNEWIEYMRFGLEARRYCTQLGGYYQLFPPGRGNTPAIDMLYYLVSCAASGSHPLSCDAEYSSAGHYGRFLTRYSAMVFARDIKPLENPAQYIEFSGDNGTNLWWREFANSRTADGKRWLLFPLVVAPANPRVGQDPASLIRGCPHLIKATLKTAAFPARPRAFLLSPERDPMAEALELKQGQNGYDVELPRVMHFGLVLVETEVAR